MRGDRKHWLEIIGKYFRKEASPDGVQQKAARWLEMVSAGQREAAAAYYEEELFDEVIAHFIRKESRHAKKYTTLISLVGFSPEPLILTISALQPDYIHFLITEDARGKVDEIVARCACPPSRFEQHLVESSSADDVYQKIYAAVKAAGGKTAIDITGGKKAMVGGAAIAGSFLNCDLFYVDYEHYLPEVRKPLPGSEYLNLLANPYQVFGDVDKQAAIQLYNAGNYAAAIARLKQLVSRIPDERAERILLNVFEFHKSWEDYEFSQAVSRGQKAVDEIERRNLHRDILPVLRQRVELLRRMNGGNSALLALNHYEMSRRYNQRQRHNFAVMMLYRTVEKALAHRLAEAWRIDVSDPDYSPWPQLPENYASLAQNLYGEGARTELPAKIALMDALLILTALEDALVDEVSLKEALTQTLHRNQGILAHGDKPNTQKQYDAMNRAFRSVMEKYCRFYFNAPLAETLAGFSPLKLAGD